MKLVESSYFSLAKSYLTSLVKKKDPSSSAGTSTTTKSDSASSSSKEGSYSDSHLNDYSSAAPFNNRMLRSSTEEGLKNVNSLLMSLIGRLQIENKYTQTLKNYSYLLFF